MSEIFGNLGGGEARGQGMYRGIHELHIGHILFQNVNHVYFCDRHGYVRNAVSQNCTCNKCRDNAIGLVMSYIPALSLDGMKEALRAAVDHILTKGIR